MYYHIKTIHFTLYWFTAFGVFGTTKAFCKGDFLLQYAGELLSKQEAVDVEKKHKNNKSCYMFLDLYFLPFLEVQLGGLVV